MIFFLFLISCVSETFGRLSPWNFAHKQYKGGHTHKVSSSVPALKEQWFTQYVDHFSFMGNDSLNTFQQRYLINTEFWGGVDYPVFFYTGNEGDIWLFVNNTGFIFQVAQEMKAMIVFAEHRYYGKSMPFGQQTFSRIENLRYLSVEQALADYTNLISDLKKNISTNAPVISFGGSYGGMLSAWWRIKYPYVVSGAIAASAPIKLSPSLMNPRSFNNVVKKTFATGNKFAPHGIYLAFEKIKELGQSEKGRDELYSRMRLCSKLQTERDVDLVIDYYENAISYMAMADYPYPASFLGPMPAFPAAYAGKFFPQEDPQNSNSETLIDSMVQGIANVFYNFSGQSGSCFDVRQENPPGLEGDSWDIQCCREIIEPIGSYGWPNDVFLKNPFDIESTVQQCESKYSGTVPRKNFVIQHFGGSNLDGASRIFFSNGDLDPWISGGITRNFSVHKDVIAYVIKNGAHHLDLRFSHPDDPESVIIARNMERAAIRRWIKKYWRENDKFEQTIA